MNKEQTLSHNSSRVITTIKILTVSCQVNNRDLQLMKEFQIEIY